jgi:hypothetical protein
MSVQILHCLVCEGVRPEAGGASTLVGFLGVAPDVYIGTEPGARIDQLTFLFLGKTAAAGAYRFSVTIQAPGEADPEVVGPIPTPGEMPKGAQFRLAAKVRDIEFKQFGRHGITLFANDEKVYESLFYVGQAPLATETE